MKTLIPHLQKATQRGEYLWRLAIMFDVFDDLPFAVMAVNKQGRLLFSNRSAEVLLRIDDGVNRREGKICISGQNNTTRFAELIRNMASGTIRQEHGNKLGNALMVRRQGKQLPLWVVVSPLGRRLRRVIGQEDQVAIIFVVSPERLGNISEVTLRTLFGLTLKEQKLAKLIIEGYRLDEAATHLNISVNTARTHMKRIYAKTDTGRQTDLVRLLLTGTFNHVSVA
jgi:DNA-binding CsgD family transcriptional regulator